MDFPLSPLEETQILDLLNRVGEENLTEPLTHLRRNLLNRRVVSEVKRTQYDDSAQKILLNNSFTSSLFALHDLSELGDAEIGTPIDQRVCSLLRKNLCAGYLLVTLMEKGHTIKDLSVTTGVSAFRIRNTLEKATRFQRRIGKSLSAGVLQAGTMVYGRAVHGSIQDLENRLWICYKDELEKLGIHR